MVHDVIESLVRDLDRQTAGVLQMLPKSKWPHFAVVGDDSPFIKAVKSKAKKFGLSYEEYPGDSRKCFVTTPVIYDRETCEANILGKEADVDRTKFDGMSCVAEAIYLLLKRMDLIAYKDITIVGRGHAVKGLAEKLIAGDATVTVAHSKTKWVFKATEEKDVVVYATPKLTSPVDYDTKSLVIDLGGCVNEADIGCEYTKDIGKLTVSVILSRLVCGG